METELSTIVEETFVDSMEDRIGYQEHMDLMKDSKPIGEYHNEPQEEYGLLEKALDASLLYQWMNNSFQTPNFTPVGGGSPMHGTPYRHPNQDIRDTLPTMDYMSEVRERERERREDLYNNWATEQRKHDDPFIGGVGMKGIGSSVHFHGSDPDHLSKMHIDTGNPFGGNNDYDDDHNTQHPWFGNGYDASMLDYNAEISRNLNRFMGNNYDD